MTELPMSDPSDRPGFTPEVLDRTVISIPLLDDLREEDANLQEDPELVPKAYDIVIDINLEYEGGRDRARERTMELVLDAVANVSSRNLRPVPGPLGPNEEKSRLSQQYVFARLQGEAIRELVRLNETDAGSPTAHRPIFRIWPDFPIRAQLNKSVSTVKADAARASFSALGEDVVWAVLDSGIEVGHPHFKAHGNAEPMASLDHKDFTGTGSATEDLFGHGTHVAGIIAGEQHPIGDSPIQAVSRHRDESGEVAYDLVELPKISGMAPRCRLLSLKVLDDEGVGVVSNLIAAIEYIQQLNGYGRRLRVHGVNISVGYDFEPEWFACGQSPLCVEVDQLVRSGVVVVVAAGNTGYGWLSTKLRGTVPAGMNLTINDPGNAALAITVGSTHREMPHIYGISYFSSKGPTGDGRDKPDLVAPGEKILSCAAGNRRKEMTVGAPSYDYVEDSGTSMAAPHVSGVIAAFLSIRREFIGRPDQVKEIFLSTATDLHRDKHFQGRGLVDLMRAIQSV
jgi:subtilisin family serine protease